MQNISLEDLRKIFELKEHEPSLSQQNIADKLHIALVAFKPGISSPDTHSTMVTNAKNIYGMFDWHPFFYSLVTRKIEQVWDSTYAMVFFQWTMYICVIIELMVYLRSKKVSEYFLLGVCIFIYTQDLSILLKYNTFLQSVICSLNLRNIKWLKKAICAH